MRLQQGFFWSIAISAVLPLTLVMLLLTVTGERHFREQVSEEIHGTLSSISADMERSFAYERGIALQVSNSLAMRRYLPVLNGVRLGRLPPDFNARTDHLNRFLLSFSNVMQAQGMLRVLDLKGNTLVKVGLGSVTPPSFDGFEAVPYAEQERTELSDETLQALAELKTSEVGFIPLIDISGEDALYDGVVPLEYHGLRVGYLVTSLTGQQLDYLLQLAPRLYDGQLALLELNPDLADRHGRLLYDDEQDIFFTQTDSEVRVSREILNSVQGHVDGDFMVGTQRVYFSEVFPYPDRLLSWVLTVTVNDASIVHPFQRLRYGILLFAAIALVFSLLVAHLGAQRLARPISQLVQNLRALARGKQVELLTAHETEEIAELSEAFNEMQSNLTEAQHERDRAQGMAMQNAKLASVGQLAAGVGHELNNPLNNVISYAKLVQKDLRAERQVNENDIASIIEECERASVIIRGILNFSRQVPAHFTDFMFVEWLQQTTALVASAAKEAGVTIDIEPIEDFTLNADRGQLQQAVINLLMNAIQASKPESSIEVSAEVVDELVRVHIFNMGAAIAESELEHLFEPFYTTKDIGQGTGLGLSITLGIAEQHQGMVQIDNVMDEQGRDLGVLATIAIPLKRTADE